MKTTLKYLSSFRIVQNKVSKYQYWVKEQDHSKVNLARAKNYFRKHRLPLVRGSSEQLPLFDKLPCEE